MFLMFPANTGKRTFAEKYRPPEREVLRHLPGASSEHKNEKSLFAQNPKNN